MWSFYGTHLHKVDGKGRLSLPSDYRRVLPTGSSEIVLIASPEPDLPTLFGCPISVPEAMTRHNKRLIDTMPDARALIPKVMRSTYKLQLDEGGRIVIPTHLRKTFGLDADVDILGLGLHFEIWPRGKWEEHDDRRLDCVTPQLIMDAATIHLEREDPAE